MANPTEPVKAEKKSTAVRYKKGQIIASAKYASKKDLLNALLEEKEYTLHEVDDLIEKFMKGKVN